MGGWGKGWAKWLRENEGRVVRGGEEPTPYTGGPVAAGQQPQQRLNETERRWAERLEADADVLFWHYECVGLRLGKGLFYYPDFLVLKRDARGIPRYQVHEVKGSYIRRTGRDKFLAAMERYGHLRFQLWQWADEGTWKKLEDNGTGG